MNKLSFRVGALLALLVLVAAPPLLSEALEYRTGDQPTFASSEKLGDDLYMAGGNVTALGELSGDLWAAGGNVVLSGPVSQDVVAAGGTVSVLGTVGDDARLAGGTILLQGSVGNNLLIGGGQVTIGGGGIGGDALIGAGTIRIDAPIRGDVKVGGGQVTINARIGGNAEIMAEELTLGPNAVIEGDLKYTSSKEATMEAGAVVRGETVYTEQARDVRDTAKAGIAAFITVLALAKAVATFIAALVIGLVFKRYSHELVVRSAAQPWKRLGIGAVFFVLMPIVSIVLLFTLIGTIFGIMGILAYILSLIFASIISPIILGSVVHKWIWKPDAHEVNWKTILLGTVLVLVAGIVPVIGGVLVFALLLISLGAMLSIKRDVANQWK